MRSFLVPKIFELDRFALRFGGVVILFRQGNSFHIAGLRCDLTGTLTDIRNFHQFTSYTLNAVRPRFTLHITASPVQRGRR